MKTIGLLLALTVCIMTSAPAQTRELSLKQALELAVQHSYQLKKAQAERKASLAELQSAKAARLPTLSAEAFVYYNDDIPSFDITLPSDMTISRDVGSKENYQTNLWLSVPLFTGGKITSGIQAANTSLDMHQALEEASLNVVLYQTRVKYMSLYQADRLLEAAQASMERTKIIMKDMESLFKAGAADSVDLLDADLAYNKAFLKVEQAVSRRRSAKIELTSLLNLPARDSLVISDVLPPPVAREFLHPFMSKPELRAADASVALSKSQLRQVQSAYFPTISAYCGYSYGKPNLDLFNKTWRDYFTVGTNLTWSFNIGRKEAREVQRAKLLYQAAQKECDDVTERLDREARLALERLALVRQMYNTARLNKRTSSDNYRLATKKHRQGVLSSNRLLEIEAELSEAEAAEASVTADYYIAESAYYFSLGSEQLKEGF